MIPTNLADAIQAAREGELGLIEEIKIGDLTVSALMELDAPESLMITKKPIQNGFSMTDAAIDDRQPIVMTILLANPVYSLDASVDALISGDVEQFTQTWRDKKRELYQMKNDREIIDVQTHEEIYTSVMIQSIAPIYNTANNWDAFFCNIVLERIRVLGESEQNDNLLASALQDVGEL